MVCRSWGGSVGSGDVVAGVVAHRRMSVCHECSCVWRVRGGSYLFVGSMPMVVPAKLFVWQARPCWARHDAGLSGPFLFIAVGHDAWAVRIADDDGVHHMQEQAMLHHTHGVDEICAEILRMVDTAKM